MTTPIHLLCSMATRELLAVLAAQYSAETGVAVHAEAVGGVDVARRVRAGEALDAVVLAGETIDALIASGHVLPGSRVDLVRSGVAIAVRAGAAQPDIGSEDAVKAAVLAAHSVSYSTGPSGLHLSALFERWGIAAEVAGRTVQAPPGVAVGTLLARGDAEIGFQQLSELMHLPGITVLGPLPQSIQVVTTFSGGIAATCARHDAVRVLLTYIASPAAAGARRANGMDAAA